MLTSMLEMFPTLDVHDVSEILAGNNWDLEASFEAALALNSSRDIIEEEYIVRDQGSRILPNEGDDLPSKSKVNEWSVPNTNTNPSASSCSSSNSPPSSSSSSSSLNWPSFHSHSTISRKGPITLENLPEIIHMYREAAIEKYGSNNSSSTTSVKCR